MSGFLWCYLLKKKTWNLNWAHYCVYTTSDFMLCVNVFVQNLLRRLDVLLQCFLVRTVCADLMLCFTDSFYKIFRADSMLCFDVSLFVLGWLPSLPLNPDNGAKYPTNLWRKPKYLSYFICIFNFNRHRILYLYL